LVTRKNLAARLSPQQDLRENLRTAADLGLGGVIIEAIGPMSPSELSRTGRREVRALLNSGALALDALALPARRTIADIDQWEDRLARMRFAMEMAYELGTRRVCVAPGAVPADDKNRSLFVDHLKQLADVAERHGISLICEAGLDPFHQLVETISGMKHPSLSISLDPGRLLASGQDFAKAAESAHALLGLVYATDPEFLGLGISRSGQCVDWERFRDILEEVGYRGRWIIWPEASMDLVSVVTVMGRRLKATPKF
jgi:sugar phosphate isomerase/epimerase